MATLSIVVNGDIAPITTQMKRFAKGVEHCYYGLLFSSPSYSDRTETWNSWLRQGFHIGIKEAPPDATQTDRLKVSVRPDGRVMEVTVSSANSDAIQQLLRLLQNIDNCRIVLKGKDQATKSQELLADEKIGQQLLRPVLDGLNKSGLRGPDVDSYRSMIERGLLALTNNEIGSVQFSVN